MLSCAKQHSIYLSVPKYQGLQKQLGSTEYIALHCNVKGQTKLTVSWHTPNRVNRK